MTLKVNIHIFGLTKYTNYTVKNVPVFVPVLLYAVTMLIFHIKRIISSEKWFNYVVTFFFLKMPKIWVGRTTVNRKKKRMTKCTEISLENFYVNGQKCYKELLRCSRR